VRALISAGRLSAVHDVSDGGLLVAVAEMAMASGIGATLLAGTEPAHGFWFGEDQGRYVVTVPAAQIDAAIATLAAAGVPVARLGTTGGDALTLAGGRPILVTLLRERFESWLPAYMSGAPA
jgi:phosphoribosylformylglycinamidine synthase subunit PurL